LLYILRVFFGVLYKGPEVFRWFAGRKSVFFKPVIDPVAQIGTRLQVGCKLVQT
jgi:hypothetical protein